MDHEPAELIVLGFPGERADPAVAEVLTVAVSRGYVTVLDLVFLTRTPDGILRVAGVEDNLDRVGLGSLEIRAQALIGEDHLGAVRAAVKPGTSAAVIAYENGMARRLAAATRYAGGTVIARGLLTREAGGAGWAGGAREAGGAAPFAVSAGQQAVAESQEAVRQAEAEAAAAERAAERYASLRPGRAAGADGAEADDAGGDGAAGAGDLATQLSDLARLREKGALSAAEFAAAKARLLGGLGTRRRVSFVSFGGQGNEY